MKYLLMIYDQENTWQSWDEDYQEAWVGRYQELAGQLQEQGVFISGERLGPIASASSVRVRNGETLITDGPFAETKEQLGGFFLVECRDLDHATKIAAQIPSAEIGTIEVRPLWYQDK